jgi:hypothetical protein
MKREHRSSRRSGEGVVIVARAAWSGLGKMRSLSALRAQVFAQRRRVVEDAATKVEVSRVRMNDWKMKESTRKKIGAIVFTFAFCFHPVHRSLPPQLLPSRTCQ